MTVYCCPVCVGKGIVPNGFYRTTNDSWTSSDAAPEKCKSCNGGGVIYST